MRPGLFALIFFSILFAPGNSTYAAFVPKKHNNTVVIVTTMEPTKVITEIPNETTLPKYRALKLLLHDENWHPKKHAASKSGWEGIASLVLALRGILMFPPAFIAAIVLGAMGMGKGAKHRGMAIAGLTIGLLGAFFWGFLLAMAVA